MQIKSYAWGTILFEDPGAVTMKALVEAAVKAKADLSGANLSGANLSGAKLSGANLKRANLSEANLSEANLSGANLYWADLSLADLSLAVLSGADLELAHLSGANLSRAEFSSYESLLKCAWGTVSDALCVALMDYDCANLDDGIDKFDEWKRNGQCPFSDSRIHRSVEFCEKKSLWIEGRSSVSPLTARELVQWLVREKCADSDWHSKV